MRGSKDSISIKLVFKTETSSFFLDDFIMSKIIDQSIQEYEMISPECSGHESNTNEIQMRDDGQCHKLCKMEHEDIKHSKTKENAFQDENHQLHQDDIM